MKLLFISNKNFVTRIDSGGAQCSKRNYELCIKAFGKENVYLLVITDEDNVQNGIDILGVKGKAIEIASSNIKKYGNMFFLRDCYSKNDKVEIKKYFEYVNPEIVFFDGSSFGYLSKMINPKAKIYAFYHNIEKRYAQSRIMRTNLLCIIKFFSFWKNEKYLTQRANHRICLNKRDSDLLYKIYKKKADYILPISFENIYVQSNFAKMVDENMLLFVGSYFMPNVRGIIWFCKKVMPYIKNKRLVIVGKNMERLRNKLECKNVEVVGTVNNLQSYYEKAAAMVMPIFVGDGMKVKTAEALMYGKTIFGTREAFEGYDIENVEGLYCCNSAKEFIKEINTTTELGYNQNIHKLFQSKYCTSSLEHDFVQYIINTI